jgi:integrase
MGRKRIPGLTKRGEIWHINKKVNGCRICESTGTSNLQEAEQYLVRKLEEIRQAKVFGIRPKRTFREAAIKFVQENGHKASLCTDIGTIKQLDKYIGQMPLETIHIGSLQTFIEQRKNEGVKIRTINYGLQLVRHILNLAASEWMDEHALTWIASAPKIKLLPENDKRKPYPLSWDEQNRLFVQLPLHLKRMALFAVNTGCRDREICNLRWEWEIKTPHGSVFIIPGQKVKNREDRLVILNQISQSVIEEMRNKHSEFVFTYKGKPINRMLNSAWKKARLRAGLTQVRVHDLKHTFGRRLRAAGVSFEDRQDLLGHKSGRITTHYSTAELNSLVTASNKVCEENVGVILTSVTECLNKNRAKVAQEHMINLGG